MKCYHCGAETTNGLALCELCRHKVATDLDFLPVYFRNLARWRPGRAGARPVPGSRALFDGSVHDGASDRIWRALDEAGNDLTTWARALADDRCLKIPNGGDNEAEQAAVLCAWLREHLTTIATLEWCGEFVRSWRSVETTRQGIGHHEKRLRELTEAVMPGWYAGACRVCTLPTHVVPGLTWVTCAGCGTTTYARDHLDTVLDEMSDWVASPKRIAEAVVALRDDCDSVEDLRKRIAIWGARGHLAIFRAHDHLPKHYRFGDVIELLTRKSQAA